MLPALQLEMTENEDRPSLFNRSFQIAISTKWLVESEVSPPFLVANPKHISKLKLMYGTPVPSVPYMHSGGDHVLCRSPDLM